MFAERKFKLALAALFLITTGWIASGSSKILSDSFPEYRTGLMGVLILYYTGNVGSKFVGVKYKSKEE